MKRKEDFVRYAKITLLLSNCLITIALLTMHQKPSVLLGPFGIYQYLVSSLEGRLLLVGLFFLVLSSISSTTIEETNKLYFALFFISLILSTLGVPLAVESLPRFRYSYFTYSFVLYVYRYHQLNSSFIFYHYWPNFSVFGAILFNVALPSVMDQLTFLKMFPLIVVSLYFLSIFLFFRDNQEVYSTKILVFLMLIYLATNWTNQEYFSPQAVALVFVLDLMYLITHKEIFNNHIIFILIILSSTLFFTHLLSSMIYLMFIAVWYIINTTSKRDTGDNMSKRRAREGKRESPRFSVLLLSVILFIIWMLYYAHDYVANNIMLVIFQIKEILRRGILAYFENIGGTLQRQKGDFAHSFIAKSMLVSTFMILILAFYGLIFRLRALKYKVTLPERAGFTMLFGIGIVGIFLGKYGNEYLIRAYLFMLPFIAFYISYWLGSVSITTKSDYKNIIKIMAILGLMLVLLNLHILLHYGNERYDKVTVSEFEGVIFLDKFKCTPEESWVDPLKHLVYVDLYKNTKNKCLVFSYGAYQYSKMYGRESHYNKIRTMSKLNNRINLIYSSGYLEIYTRGGRSEI